MAETGWHLKEFGSEGQDLTERFNALVGEIRAGTAVLPAEANSHIYLLVPGLFTKHYPGYMDSNVAHLGKRGLVVREVPIDTNVGVTANSEKVRDAVLAAASEGKKVVVLGHSKGGVDAACAICEYDLYKHVRAFIPLQAPCGGTPVVDMFDGNNVLEAVTRAAVTHVLKGDMKALEDLSYASRRKSMKRLGTVDTRRLPTVSFLSQCGTNTTAMSPMRAYVEKKYGLQSDGAVTLLDAKFPGAPFVFVVGIDHGGTVFGKGSDKIAAPGEIFEAMIAIALALQQEGDKRDAEKDKKKDKKEDKNSEKDKKKDDDKEKKDKKDKKEKKGDEKGDKKEKKDKKEK